MKRRNFLAGALLAAAAPDMLGANAIDAAPQPSTAPVATGSATRSIIELNPPEFLLPILQNMQMRAIKPTPRKPPIYQSEQLVLLHFADIHNDVKNLRRVMEFALHYKQYLTDSLLTGDIAGGSWNDWSDEMMAVPGFKDVLKTLGNHDIYKWNKTTRDATPRECHDKYFAGIESWGVVQPGGTNPDGLCYWYKDYPACGVRLIGLDCMHYDDAQQAWLVNTLNDARAKGLAVVTCQHYPPAADKAVTGLPNCPFDSLQRESLGGALPRAVEAVDAFQKDGGEFVCWLGGHTHTDFCGVINGKKQLFINVGTAKNFELWCDSRRVTGEKSQDLFNVVSIDTCRKHIRVLRIGAECNRYLQHGVTICLDSAARRQVG